MEEEGRNFRGPTLNLYQNSSMLITTILGAGDGAQPTEAKCLLGKCEGLVPIPTDCIKLSAAVFVCNPRVGEATTARFLDLAGRPA